ncbi:MAG: ABC transporter substrate-binding protein [Lachnospiraceae bacterium]|nr:ABC transporter substrate-binding protein [Lachnospiraceae bacterium]
MKKKTLTCIAAVMTALSLLAGCGNESPAAPAATAEATVTEAAEEPVQEEPAKEEPAKEEPAQEEVKAEEPEASAAAKSMKDRSGNEIEVPAEVKTIVSMAPSITRVLIDLGLADQIVCSDTNTQASYGSELSADVLYMDMMAPDLEKLVALAPDIIFTSGMSSKDGVDAFATVREAGICVADIPSSTSLEAIKEDLIFIGTCIGKESEGKKLADEMQADLDKISAIAATIPEEEKKTVLFELFTPSADYPTIYTAGPGTYINEMLETAGAINIAKDEASQWPALTEEAAVGADPQVILTADMYTPDVINTILKMQGWENVTAIKNGAVYQLNADEVNQPNHHVIDALWDMAESIYPEYFGEEAALKPAA